MTALFLIGGILMLLVPGAITAGNGKLVVALFTGHMLCYMPTLGLGNTIAFSNLPRDVFPKTRVWGTIGWIAAGLVAGFLGWSDSLNLFRMAGISAVARCVLLSAPAHAAALTRQAGRSANGFHGRCLRTARPPGISGVHCLLDVDLRAAGLLLLQHLRIPCQHGF